MRKRIVVCGLAVLLVTLLASCGQPKLKEAQIKKDIGAKTEIFRDGDELFIEKIDIERQQHNEKNEVVYCVATFGNEYHEEVRYYLLSYDYFDEGGWYLQEMNEYQNREYAPRSGVSEKVISYYVLEKYNLNTQYEVLDHIPNLDEKIDTVKLRIWEDGTVLSYAQEVTVEWRMPEYDYNWVYWGTAIEIHNSYTFHDVEGDWYLNVLGMGMTKIHITLHDVQWEDETGSITATYREKNIITTDWVTIATDEAFPLEIGIESTEEIIVSPEDDGLLSRFTPLSFTVRGENGGKAQIYLLPNGIYLYVNALNTFSQFTREKV